MNHIVWASVAATFGLTLACTLPSQCVGNCPGGTTRDFDTASVEASGTGSAEGTSTGVMPGLDATGSTEQNSTIGMGESTSGTATDDEAGATTNDATLGEDVTTGDDEQGETTSDEAETAGIETSDTGNPEVHASMVLSGGDRPRSAVFDAAAVVSALSDMRHCLIPARTRRVPCQEKR